MRKRNGFEDINVMNFVMKIFLKFVIIFRVSEKFCPFLSLTIITRQENFLGLADELFDKTPETKNGCERFVWKRKSFAKCGNLSLKFFIHEFFSI